VSQKKTRSTVQVGASAMAVAEEEAKIRCSRPEVEEKK
jgi:hypothetical protein